MLCSWDRRVYFTFWHGASQRNFKIWSRTVIHGFNWRTYKLWCKIPCNQNQKVLNFFCCVTTKIWKLSLNCCQSCFYLKPVENVIDSFLQPISTIFQLKFDLVPQAWCLEIEIELHSLKRSDARKKVTKTSVINLIILEKFHWVPRTACRGKCTPLVITFSELFLPKEGRVFC